MDVERARELVAGERERIEKALSELKSEGLAEAGHDDQPGEDRSSELATDERDRRLLEQLREELESVARAEQRIANGTYGLSIESGVEIPEARLEAMPLAERTVQEQERYDRGF